MQNRFEQDQSERFAPISVIIPCRNEGRRKVKAAINKLTMFASQHPLDILVVENGSDYLEGIDDARYYPIEQGGLGLALKLGLMRAHEEKVFFLPADMSYDLSFIDMALYFDMADIVIASKFLKGSRVERPWQRQVASRIYGLKNRYWEGVKVHDVTGAKMFDRRKVLPLLGECHSIGIRFEIELIKAAIRHKLSIKEIPAIVHDYGKGGLFRWL
jgi:glycosyltransferase involved in cell wall biosynthesis